MELSQQKIVAPVTFADDTGIVKQLSFFSLPLILFPRVRAAAILGLGCAEKDLRPFQAGLAVEWFIGLPGARNEADAVLIFGGDGTIHRHLGALVELGLPVLVVPRGSGNDFARALGLRRVRDALASWCRFTSGAGNVRRVDLGVIGRATQSSNTPEVKAENQTAGEPSLRYFCCIGGVGLDAETARRANRLPRWLRGRGGYALSLLPALARFAAFPMKLWTSEGQFPADLVLRRTEPTAMAAFANTPNYGGGMTLAPKAQMDDGMLDVCLITDVNRFKLFCLFPTVYFGQHLGVRNVEYFQAARLRIETETPQDVYADGEYVCQTPVEVSVVPDALGVIVP